MSAGLTRIFANLVIRDIRIAYNLGGSGGDAQGGFLLPVLFFITVAILYPFSVGPDAPLLQRTGTGIIWVAAILSAILPIDRLISPDRNAGFYDQYAVRGISEELIMLAKIVSHWCASGPPLLLASLIAIAVMDIPNTEIPIVLTGLLLATPGLSGLAVMIAAMIASMRTGNALAGLLFLPLAIPMLIFGAGSIRPGGENGLLLLASISLLLTAISPFAAAAALRAGRE
jgi:heme exporter protein B